MKICQKKNVSIEDENVLVQLERRHTLKEDTNEVDLEDNLRKTTRANSLGSSEGHSSTDIEAVIAKKQNKCSRKPTVITESELSSSSLYKDRKAKINSDDESIEDPKSTRASENYPNIEPRILQDPNLKPVPVLNQRSRKKSSCCWYFTIILVICIACLVVMAGIGGIVFMEFFATYELADTDTLLTNDENPLATKDIFHQSSHKQDKEPEILDNVVKDVIVNSTFSLDTNMSRKIIVHTSRPEKDKFHRHEPTHSGHSKTKELKKIKSNVYKTQDEDYKIAERSIISRYIHAHINNFKVPVSDKLKEIKTKTEKQNPSDFKFTNQTANHDRNKISDAHADESNEQMIENENIMQKKSNLELEVSNTSEVLLHKNSNFEMTSLKGLESQIELVNSNISLQSLPKQNSTEHSVHILPTVNYLGPMNNTIDDSHEDNLFDHKHSIDHDTKSLNHDTKSLNHDINSLNHTESSTDNREKKGFLHHLEHFINHSRINNSWNLEHLIDHSSKINSLEQAEHSTNQNSQNNALEHIEHLIDHSPEKNFLEEIEHSIEHNPKDNSSDDRELAPDHNNTFLNDRNEDSRDYDSDDSSSEEYSLSDDEIKNSNDSVQLVFIRPVVESKAIPVPLEFLRRIGFDIKNPDNHHTISASDMDIKFSLAEALKYLKSLDADNKLPDSREKTVTQQRMNQKGNKKKLPVIIEREGYLDTLRKQMFEENL